MTCVGVCVPRGGVMRSVQRSVRPEVQVAHLEKKHAELKARVDELEGRGYLSDEERHMAQVLKKQKLAAKDELQRARARCASE